MSDLTKDQIHTLLKKQYGYEFDNVSIYKKVYDKCEDWYKPNGAEDEYNIACDLHTAGALKQLCIPKIKNGFCQSREWKFKKVKT